MTGWKKMEDMRIVGRRHTRIEAPQKVTGKARYTDDLKLPGMLYGAILHSPNAHSEVKSIDASTAEALPGVRAVLTDLNQHPRFHGDEVAAVAADTQAIARDALAHIQVQYKERPFVVDAVSAMQDDAPRVFEDRTNLRDRDPEEQGDIEQGFAEAEVVVEATFRTQVQTHSPFETHGLIAHWEGDQLTLYASTQGVYSVRDQIARHFEIPQEKVRVICEHMGGGFGSKLWAWPQTAVAVRLARETKAPVKLMLTREQEFLYAGNRPAEIMELRLGARKDGTLIACKARSFGTAGVQGGAGVPLPYIYAIPNFRHKHSDVFTNTGPAAPMRAPGHPQAAFAMEQAMDMLAENLNLDPLEFRKMNDPNPTRQKEYILGAEAIGWSHRNPKSGSQPGLKQRGLGIGTCRWGGGGRGTQAHLMIHPDGQVEIRCGTQDIGTGTRSILAEVVAEELGLTVEDITVRIGDTDYPRSGSSGGSTTAASVTPAAKIASEKALEALQIAIAPKLGVKPDQISVAPGRLVSTDGSGLSLKWTEACALLGTESISVVGDWEEGLSDRGVAGVQFAEVEVDTETGQVRVLRVVAVHDCGLVINRLKTESQIIGGVIQGTSWALLENRVMDTETGRMLNTNMEAYKILGPTESPQVEVILVDEPERGVIGIGEPPVIPTAAAIANAVYNAVGVRMFELPLTPARVLEALYEKRAGQ